MEPSPPNPKSVVTVEKTPQITTNFRAAKSLLDRKRPFTAFRNGDGFQAKVPQQDPPMRRNPLNEVHSNSFLQRSNSSRSWIVECPQRSKLGRSDGNEEDCLRSAVNACANQNFSVAADGFVMPSPEVSVCSERSASALGSSLCCVLDDEFDESILKEIDEICEQRSVEKSSLVNKSDVLDWVDVPIESAEKDEESKPDDVCGSAPQSYLDYWKSLNEKQREAACSNVSTPLMIMAGPGSGKTSTMVGRVLMLLKEDFHPSNILAMTFTTAAASEMRDRIAAVVGKAVAKELAISTFHSFSLQLCRSHAEKLGRTSEFVIYGHGQQRRAIIEAFRLSQNEEKDVPAIESIKDRSKKWEKFVTKAKASGRTPEELREKGDEMGATILANYENILKSCNALDYHDFIICSVKLLTNFPEVYKECQETWKAIVVDEFQDTSSMQYTLLRLLASHNCLTVIGDNDQSIFSFNGADVGGFESFRRDFQKHKEVRLTMNYRSTRCIVEAASALIRHNSTRCRLKDVTTFNSAGHKITLMECRNDESQCAFVVDKIIELTSGSSGTKSSFSDIAILYRKQVTGKAFQSSFRERKLPFNVHGVAFYRKKVIKAIIAILRTTLPHCSDIAFRQSFKALLICDKDEKKKVIDHIEKITMARNSSFKSVAEDIFRAKISGTFKRSQILQGRKVLSSLSMLTQLVRREKSITTVISSTANMIPQTYLLEKRAVVDLDNGKYLNEEHDLRSVLRYLLDDVSDFLSTHFSNPATGKDILSEENGCLDILSAFLDYISSRETENFRTRKDENDNSITLTTIHQSKGLEWDTVFIVKVNESEIPLLHENNGVAKGGATVEEERRLLYVAMTRARKKLYILHVIMDSNWQMLQPSRFLKEIPGHLIEGKVETDIHLLNSSKEASGAAPDESRCEPAVMAVTAFSPSRSRQVFCDDSKEFSEECFNNCFLKTFNIEDRSSVSHMFHRWAKKPVFQNPKRLLDKVGFVIEERLRNKATKNKDLLRMLRARLADNDSFQYAQEVLRWEQIPFDIRAHLTREKQEHFQKQKIESAMTSSSATPKQISYLQMLGCTVVPTSRLHASKLIEQYKSL